jgi:hypothetical protein
MNRRKTRFSENESGIFFASHLDSKRRIENACEIRRSAQVLPQLFVASKQGNENKIAQVICPTCRIGHSAQVWRPHKTSMQNRTEQQSHNAERVLMNAQPLPGLNRKYVAGESNSGILPNTDFSLPPRIPNTGWLDGQPRSATMEECMCFL